VKYYLLIVGFFLLTTLTAACSSPTPSPEVQLPSLPTPDVPPTTEIDEAIELWEDSNTVDYYIEVEERNQDGQWTIRIVVADGQIRSAQRLDYDAEGDLGEPYSISQEEAQAYTIESILQRLRADSIGEGPSLFNIITAFDNLLGYPRYIHAEALPSYTEEGTLELNRQHSYDLSSQVKMLLEYTFGTDQEPIFTLLRSGGPEAWCDSLNVYPDGSSIYSDDCRNEVWQIPIPESRLMLLNELSSSFASMDDLRSEDEQTQRLLIQGTGVGTPSITTLEESWLLSEELHEILSEPTGLGLVMSYVFGGDLYGFDIFNKVTLPSQLSSSGDFLGAVLNNEGDLLAFSDDEGLGVFDIQNQGSTLLLPTPEDGYYLPRSWSNSGRLLVSHLPDNEGEPIRHGWITVEDKTWQELPTPEGIHSYGCDTGAVWSPEGGSLAITGLEYGEPCSTSPGLTTIDLPSNRAQVVIAPTLNTFDDDATLIAGAHTPAWSQDGTWIAFGLDQEPTEAANFPTRLYRVHPDGSNLTPLTSNSQGYATNPVWAHDGSLFYGLSGAGADIDGLYQYLPNDNSHLLLLPGMGIHPLSISPDGEFLLFEQDQILKIWRIRLQEIVAEIPGDEENPTSFAGWILIERIQQE
jgi:hypothetical protein